MDKSRQSFYMKSTMNETNDNYFKKLSRKEKLNNQIFNHKNKGLIPIIPESMYDVPLRVLKEINDDFIFKYNLNKDFMRRKEIFLGNANDDLLGLNNTFAGNFPFLNQQKLNNINRLSQTSLVFNDRKSVSSGVSPTNKTFKLKANLSPTKSTSTNHLGKNALRKTMIYSAGTDLTTLLELEQNKNKTFQIALKNNNTTTEIIDPKEFGVTSKAFVKPKQSNKINNIDTSPAISKNNQKDSLIKPSYIKLNSGLSKNNSFKKSNKSDLYNKRKKINEKTSKMKLPKKNTEFEIKFNNKNDFEEIMEPYSRKENEIEKAFQDSLIKTQQFKTLNFKVKAVDENLPFFILKDHLNVFKERKLQENCRVCQDFKSRFKTNLDNFSKIINNKGEQNINNSRESERKVLNKEAKNSFVKSKIGSEKQKKQTKSKSSSTRKLKLENEPVTRSNIKIKSNLKKPFTKASSSKVNSKDDNPKLNNYYKENKEKIISNPKLVFKTNNKQQTGRGSTFNSVRGSITSQVVKVLKATTAIPDKKQHNHFLRDKKIKDFSAIKIDVNNMPYTINDPCQFLYRKTLLSNDELTQIKQAPKKIEDIVGLFRKKQIRFTNFDMAKYREDLDRTMKDVLKQSKKSTYMESRLNSLLQFRTRFTAKKETLFQNINFQLKANQNDNDPELELLTDRRKTMNVAKTNPRASGLFGENKTQFIPKRRSDQTFIGGVRLFKRGSMFFPIHQDKKPAEDNTKGKGCFSSNFNATMRLEKSDIELEEEKSKETNSQQDSKQRVNKRAKAKETLKIEDNETEKKEHQSSEVNENKISGTQNQDNSKEDNKNTIKIKDKNEIVKDNWDCKSRGSNHTKTSSKHIESKKTHLLQNEKNPNIENMASKISNKNLLMNKNENISNNNTDSFKNTMKRLERKFTQKISTGDLVKSLQFLHKYSSSNISNKNLINNENKILSIAQENNKDANISNKKIESIKATNKAHTTHGVRKATSKQHSKYNHQSSNNIRHRNTKKVVNPFNNIKSDKEAVEISADSVHFKINNKANLKKHLNKKRINKFEDRRLTSLNNYNTLLSNLKFPSSLSIKVDSVSSNSKKEESSLCVMVEIENYNEFLAHKLIDMDKIKKEQKTRYYKNSINMSNEPWFERIYKLSFTDKSGKDSKEAFFSEESKLTKRIAIEDFDPYRVDNHTNIINNISLIKKVSKGNNFSYSKFSLSNKKNTSLVKEEEHSKNKKSANSSKKFTDSSKSKSSIEESKSINNIVNEEGDEKGGKKNVLNFSVSSQDNSSKKNKHMNQLKFDKSELSLTKNSEIDIVLDSNNNTDNLDSNNTKRRKNTRVSFNVNAISQVNRFNTKNAERARNLNKTSINLKVIEQDNLSNFADIKINKEYKRSTRNLYNVNIDKYFDKENKGEYENHREENQYKNNTDRIVKSKFNKIILQEEGRNLQSNINIYDNNDSNIRGNLILLKEENKNKDNLDDHHEHYFLEKSSNKNKTNSNEDNDSNNNKNSNNQNIVYITKDKKPQECINKIQVSIKEDSNDTLSSKSIKSIPYSIIEEESELTNLSDIEKISIDSGIYVKGHKELMNRKIGYYYGIKEYEKKSLYGNRVQKEVLDLIKEKKKHMSLKFPSYNELKNPINKIKETKILVSDFKNPFNYLKHNTVLSQLANVKNNKFLMPSIIKDAEIMLEVKEKQDAYQIEMLEFQLQQNKLKLNYLNNK